MTQKEVVKPSRDAYEQVVSVELEEFTSDKSDDDQSHINSNGNNNSNGDVLSSHPDVPPSSNEKKTDNCSSHGVQADVDEEEEEEGVLVPIDDAIERLGMGPFQFLILIASGLCFAADAMQVILLSFLTAVIEEDWNLTEGKAANITGVLFVGAMIGTLILGPLADWLGRRPVFLMAASIISVAGIATSISPNYEALLASIFVVGFGVGGLTVPFDILAEFLPSSHRGTNLLVIEYFWTVGCLYVVLVAYATLSDHQDHWRYFVALCSIPCIVSVLIGYCAVPESPRWLCSKGRTGEAMEILRQAVVLNGHEVDAIFPQHVALMEEPEEKHATVSDLLKPRWREITLRLWGGWGAFAFGYYGTVQAVTRVFERRGGGGGGAGETMEEEEDSAGYDFDYPAIFLSSAAELVGTTIVILTVDRVGRIPLQVVCYACGGIAVLCLCLLASYEGVPHAWVLLFGFAARVFEMGGSCVTWVSTAEILTTDVRSAGHATANAVAKLGSFFSPYVVDTAPLKKIGIVMLIVHVFTVFCVSKLPETMGRDMGVTPDGIVVTGNDDEVTVLVNDDNDDEQGDDHHETSDEHSLS